MPQHNKSYFVVCTCCYQLGRIVCADGTRGLLIGTKTGARKQLALFVGQELVSAEDAVKITASITASAMHESFRMYDETLEDLQVEDPLYTKALEADHPQLLK